MRLHTNANLFVALRNGFAADLDAIAVECTHGLAYSWRDLERASAQLANLLASLGLPPNARVVVQVDKSVEAMLLYLATLRAGLVYVPLNTAYQSAEMAYFIADAEPSVVVCSGTHFGWVSQLAFKAGVPWVFSLNDDRTGTLLQRAAQCDDQHQPVHRSAQDLAAIVYTSGTTGRSKGAMLSHGNLWANAQVLKDHWGWQSPDARGQGGDVLIHALPIFHVHGLFVAIHGALLAGAKMRWHDRFDARRVVDDLARATVFMGVPTMYVRMLQEPALSPQGMRPMRLFISGSAPLLAQTFEAWQQRTGHTILERYGMSETVMLTSNPYHAVGDVGDAARVAGTVGLPLPGVSLQVVGEQGQPLAAGEIGGIEVKGPSVFCGYWRMPEKTAEDFTAQGYFKTGDVGYVEPHGAAKGYVRIVGRSKDLFISGGYNVYPAEVERFINDLPGVADCAVVGVPHPDLGEVGVAVVVPQAGAALDGAALLAQLKTQLAHYKVPKRCESVAELPRNAMGKVQKNLLRTQLCS